MMTTDFYQVDHALGLPIVDLDGLGSAAKGSDPESLRAIASAFDAACREFGFCYIVNHGVDQQTIEARAYAVARAFHPLLVNTVVGFIGPEYLYDGKQIIRAALEDHFCGKLLGLPMGVDICYTNHAEADQDDMDNLLTLLGVAGCNFIMGVPGSDDVMLNYQSTSFHDALYIRNLLGLRPAPEFEQWLIRQDIIDHKGMLKQQINTRLLKEMKGLWTK